MKKTIVLLAVLLSLSIGVLADMLTMDSDETLTPQASDTMRWEITRINATEKILEVKYVWLDDNLNKIHLNRQGINVWRCRNIEVPGENLGCIASEDPYECCTGEGTGTCDDMLDTCFSDVFGFKMRTEDVGKSIGIGLRTLIWNKMKADVLTGGNDGTFGE